MNTKAREALSRLRSDEERPEHNHLSCAYRDDCYACRYQKALDEIEQDIEKSESVARWLARKLASHSTNLIGMMAETLSRGLKGEEVDPRLDREKHLDELTELWIAGAEQEVG
jgi:hypothetical protein